MRIVAWTPLKTGLSFNVWRALLDADRDNFKVQTGKFDFFGIYRREALKPVIHCLSGVSKSLPTISFTIFQQLCVRLFELDGFARVPRLPRGPPAIGDAAAQRSNPGDGRSGGVFLSTTFSSSRSSSAPISPRRPSASRPVRPFRRPVNSGGAIFSIRRGMESVLLLSGRSAPEPSAFEVAGIVPSTSSASRWSRIGIAGFDVPPFLGGTAVGR
jgi:hypothetical protein